MNAHRLETTLTEEGTLTLTGLPFPAGARVEVIVLENGAPSGGDAAAGDEPQRYSLRGTVLKYDDPFGPAVPEDDWDVLR